MRFVIHGAPRTKANHMQIAKGRNGRPFVRQSKTTEKYENDAVLQLQSQRHGRTLMGPVNLCALVYREKNHAADLNNYIKLIGDALQRSGVIANDRQIYGHDGSRLLVDRHVPRVEIELTPIESP